MIPEEQPEKEDENLIHAPTPGGIKEPSGARSCRIGAFIAQHRLILAAALLLVLSLAAIQVFVLSKPRSMRVVHDAANSSSDSPRAPSVAQSSGGHYKIIIDRYGPPDSVLSTEYDIPRPLIPSRIIYYYPERIAFAFVPDAKVGDAPPYGSWKIVGIIDKTTNNTLSFEEADARMGNRQRNR